MINKDNKSKTLFFSTYECTAVEEFLEDMALEGWLLKSIKGFRFKFTKMETKKLKYSVELVPEVSELDGPNSNAALKYREYCEYAGWTYVCEKNKLQIFYTDDYENIIPIHTDENEKFKSVLKSSLGELFSRLLLILLFSFNLYNFIFIGDLSYFLSSNLSIASAIGILLLIVINSVEIISFVSWIIRAKIKLKQDNTMPYNNYKQLKQKTFVMKLLNTIIVSVIVLGFLFSSDNFEVLLVPTLTFIVLIFLINLIVKATRKFLSERNYSRNVKHLSNFGVLAVSFIFLIVALTWVTMILVSKSDHNRNKASNNLPLTFSAFNLPEPNEEDIFSSKDRSLIGERVSYSGYTDNGVLSYTVFESNYPWAISAMEKSLVRYNEDFMKNHGGEYVDTMLLNNGVKVYVNSYGYFDILVSDNKVIDIRNGFENLSEEEFLNIVITNIL